MLIETAVVHGEVFRAMGKPGYQQDPARFLTISPGIDYSMPRILSFL